MNRHRTSFCVSCVRGLIPSLVFSILAFVVRPSLAADDVVPLASSGTLAISDVSVSKTQVARYETVEITFQMDGQWQNPFDPDEVRVDAVLAGAVGGRATVPAFFYQEYRHTVADGRESYHAVGAPCWKVRFTPWQTGRYTCELTVKNGGREITAEAPAFVCTPAGDSHGYLRISPRNPRYFEFDDGTPFCAVAIAARWHQRMARCLRSVDGTKHVIHTNFGNLNGTAEIDDLPEMELISTNIYAVKDIAQISDFWTKRLIEQFRKPYMLTEYGIGHHMGTTGYAPHDPERVMVHNGLWSPLLSGSAGTGMAWDWNWLDDDHFYRYLRAAAQLVKDVPFSRRTWWSVGVQAFEFADAWLKPYYADSLVEGFPGNYAFPPEALDRDTFTVLEDGRLDRQDLLHARLGARQSWRVPAKSFQVRYPIDGQFIVYVPELTGGPKPAPRLTASVDGKVVLEQELLPYGPLEQYDPRAYQCGRKSLGRYTQ